TPHSAPAALCRYPGVRADRHLGPGAIVDGPPHHGSDGTRGLHHARLRLPHRAGADRADPWTDGGEQPAHCARRWPGQPDGAGVDADVDRLPGPGGAVPCRAAAAAPPEGQRVRKIGDMIPSEEAIEHLDRRFHDIAIGIATLDVLYDGCCWSEGPVWFGYLDMLLFSDIPNNRMLRYVPGLGVTPFRSPSNFVNGNTRDREGRLISCSHGARAVLRTELDGTITTLVDRHQGKRLNSPNDVVVKSDGTIWFTDPSYGILSDYEGYKSEQEQSGCHVFRFDPADGSLTIVADDFTKPNGLAFSPDESTLYVSDTGQSH